ncbi:MAG: hypothetical protein EOP53_14345 [Sphingobacteriales bacterium]|nr:MAG: hypothetical protein EOP53_14345 [Sphingobacteriales bacterium]
MRFLKPHIILLFVLSAALLSCGNKNGLPDLRETYQYKDAKPFGGKIAHALFSEIYSNKSININKKSFSKFRSDTYADSASIYMSVSRSFYCSQDDAESIIDFVEEGHTMIIASSVIDTILLDKVYCKQANTMFVNLFMGKLYNKTHTSLSLTGEGNKRFEYFYQPFNNYFSKVDSMSARVVGVNEAGRPNMIVLFLGKGRLYLHCDPRAFSNYFLLKENNYEYLQQLMQLMKPRPGNIFWDDHYNRINYREDKDGGNSALSILFKYPELTIAFWILLLLLLFYILFNGKRKQRIIPVIKPVENTSIAFTQAIAGLYMAEKDNKTIAEKMVTYFNDHIRNRYFLTTHGSGKDFVQTLSKKSGVSFESVQALYNTMEQVQQAEQVSDFELLTLNEQIQNFYKNRN